MKKNRKGRRPTGKSSSTKSIPKSLLTVLPVSRLIKELRLEKEVRLEKELRRELLRLTELLLHSEFLRDIEVVCDASDKRSSTTGWLRRQLRRFASAF